MSQVFSQTNWGYIRQINANHYCSTLLFPPHGINFRLFTERRRIFKLFSHPIQHCPRGRGWSSVLSISHQDYLPTGKESKLLVMWILKHLLLYLTWLMQFFLRFASDDSWNFLWECPCCFPRGSNVSYSTNVCVTGCQGFSRSVAPGPARNAVGWKAVRGAIVARVCPPVRLSADLSSHCHLTGQTRGGGKKGKTG